MRSPNGPRETDMGSAFDPRKGLQASVFYGKIVALRIAGLSAARGCYKRNQESLNSTFP